MKEAIRELALHYFEEIVNSKASVKELYGFADNFVKDIERTLAARKDFKED